MRGNYRGEFNSLNFIHFQSFCKTIEQTAHIKQLKKLTNLLKSHVTMHISKKIQSFLFEKAKSLKTSKLIL